MLFEPIEGTGLRRWLLSTIPFVFLGTEDRPKLSMARIVEACIVAVIAGAIAGYISVVQMEVKMDAHKERLAAVEKKIDCLDQRIFDMGVVRDRNKH